MQAKTSSWKQLKERISLRKTFKHSEVSTTGPQGNRISQNVLTPPINYLRVEINPYTAALAQVENLNEAMVALQLPFILFFVHFLKYYFRISLFTLQGPIFLPSPTFLAAQSQR